MIDGMYLVPILPEELHLVKQFITVMGVSQVNKDGAIDKVGPVFCCEEPNKSILSMPEVGIERLSCPEAIAILRALSRLDCKVDIMQCFTRQ